MIRMRRLVIRGGLSAFVLLLAMQAVRPDRTNPPVNGANTLEAQLKVPSEVEAILDRSCRDCHSHETRWPWYSHVAPSSWLLAYDVNTGRDELNFSEWAEYDAETAQKQLEHICEEVREGKMPTKPYLLMHRDARLTASDAQLLCRWTEAARAGATLTSPGEK